MTNLANGTVDTDLHNVSQTRTLLDQGYTIRHIETYHDRRRAAFSRNPREAVPDKHGSKRRHLP